MISARWSKDCEVVICKAVNLIPLETKPQRLGLHQQQSRALWLIENYGKRGRPIMPYSSPVIQTVVKKSIHFYAYGRMVRKLTFISL